MSMVVFTRHGAAFTVSAQCCIYGLFYWLVIGNRNSRIIRIGCAPLYVFGCPSKMGTWVNEKSTMPPVYDIRLRGYRVLRTDSNKQVLVHYCSIVPKVEL